MREGADTPSGEAGEDRRELAGNEAAAATAPGRAAAELAGHEASATSTAPETPEEQIMDSVSDPEFSLAQEIAYHDARQAFLEGAHRWAMFLTIALGTSAITKFGSENALALGAALVAAADIAFDFTGRAQRHADLRRRYYELVADVAKVGADEADFASRWMVISADEPPLYQWASEIAYRRACIAQRKEIPPALPFWKTALAHVWRA